MALHFKTEAAQRALLYKGYLKKAHAVQQKQKGRSSARLTSAPCIPRDRADVFGGCCTMKPRISGNAAIMVVALEKLLVLPKHHAHTIHGPSLPDVDAYFGAHK